MKYVALMYVIIILYFILCIICLSNPTSKGYYVFYYVKILKIMYLSTSSSYVSITHSLTQYNLQIQVTNLSTKSTNHLDRIILHPRRAHDKLGV